MSRLNPADKMAALLKKQEQIAEQLKQLRSREKQDERKADTRRKVIAGALALEHLSKEPHSEFARVLTSLLDTYVEERSRYLFGFLPRDASPTAGQESDAAPALPAAPAASSMAAAARATTAPR